MSHFESLLRLFVFPKVKFFPSPPHSEAINNYVTATKMIESQVLEIDDLNNQIHDLEETIGSCDEWEEELKEANEKIEIYQENIEELESDIETCEDEKKNLQVRIDDLEDELSPISGTCRFREEPNGGYSCLARNVEIESSNDQEVEWEGSHASGFSDDDVTSVIIRSQTTPLLPTNIGSAFKNIESLTVESSGLGRLSNGDFDTLSGLTSLTINDNGERTIFGEFLSHFEPF